MRYIIAVFLMAFPAVSVADEAEVALKRYADLKALSKSIRRTSSKKDVESVLGEPISKRIAGWDRYDTKVWDYFEYTDDAQHLRFSVYFDPENGCSASGSHHLRATIKKGPKVVNEGTIRTVYPNSEEGFRCIVQFDDGHSETVTVNDLTRVTGSPEEGARIRIEHHGNRFFNFVTHYSLLLESIHFSKDEGKQKTNDK